MAVAFRSGTSVVGSGAAAAPAEPTGTTAGDVVVALVVSSSNQTITPPAGWTQLAAGTFSGQFRWYLGLITRGASAPSYSFGMSATNYREVHLMCFSGVNGTTPVDVFVDGGTTTAANLDPPAMTVPTDGSMALAGGINWTGSSAGGFTPPAGYTIRSNNGAGNDAVAGSKLLTAAGVEDPAPFTNAASGASWRFSLALKDAAAGSTVVVGASVTQPAAVTTLKGASLAQPAAVTTPQGAALMQPATVQGLGVAGASLVQLATVRATVGTSLAQAAQVRALQGGTLTQPAAVYRQTGASLSQPASVIAAVGASLVQPAAVGTVPIGASLVQRARLIRLPVKVGPGVAEASVRQVIRTRAGRVYIFAADDTDDRLGQGTSKALLCAYKSGQTGTAITSFSLLPASTYRPTAGDGIAGPDARLDPATGIVHIAWTEPGGSTSTAVIKYVQFDTATDTFGAVETVSTGVYCNKTGNDSFVSRGCTQHSIALDVDGVPIVAYCKTTGIEVRKRTAGTWSAATAVSSSDTNPIHPQLVLDRAGDLHLAYAAPAAGTMKYAKRTAGTWGSVEPCGSDASGFNDNSTDDQCGSIALDSQNRPVVMYLSANATDLVKIRRRDNTGTWTADNPVGPTSGGVFAHTPQIYAQADDVYAFLGHNNATPVHPAFSWKPAGGSWAPGNVTGGSYDLLAGNLVYTGSGTATATLTGDDTSWDGSASPRMDPSRDTDPKVIDVAFFDEDDSRNVNTGTLYYVALGATSITTVGASLVQSAAVQAPSLAPVGASLVQSATVRATVGASLVQGSAVRTLSGASLSQTATVMAATGAALQQAAQVRALSGASLAQTATVRVARGSSLLQPASVQSVGTAGASLSQVAAVLAPRGASVTQLATVRAVRGGSLLQLATVAAASDIAGTCSLAHALVTTCELRHVLVATCDLTHAEV